LDVRIKQLHFDGENPRLPEEAQGKGESDLLNVLYRKFYLDELAESMAKNGYFDEEPLVAIPRKLPKKLVNAEPDSKEFLAYIKSDSTEFVVVEGNRRLATAKILLDSQLQESLRIRHWPRPSEAVLDDLRVLPIIVYVKRSEVIPYLGVRHIVGIQKWDSYAKARYIAKMINSGLSIETVEEQIGDKQGTVVKNYVCYQLLEQVKNEFDFNIAQAKDDFSLLLLAIGQGNIKRFLGLPRKLSEVDPRDPVPTDNLTNLQDLMSWIFGDGKARPIITDSREITKYLSHVVSSSEALAYLRKTRDLNGAYERSDGEEVLILRYLNTANSRLEGALGIAHRHRTPEVISEVEKCEKTVKALLKIVKEPMDD
jgi:hypothetical protein